MTAMNRRLMSALELLENNQTVPVPAPQRPLDHEIAEREGLGLKRTESAFQAAGDDVVEGLTDWGGR